MRRTVTISLLLTCVATLAVAQDQMTQFVRFSYQDGVSYGIVDGTQIRVIEGDIFGDHRLTGEMVSRENVRLLAPAVPSMVIAIGLNYRSHIGQRPTPEYPGMFAKYPTSIIGPDEGIVMPPDAQSLHYEGGLSMSSGNYIYTERTTSWMLTNGLALGAGPFTIRAMLPVFLIDYCC